MGVETPVRMGKLAATATAGDVLVTIGLGSCIGLVLVDPVERVVGLAHVMLPQAPAGGASTPDQGKFADLAAPALVRAVERLGGRRAGLQAALVGGAHMFSFGERQLDVGTRNEAAVRASLGALGVPVRAAATGGDRGRTVRVRVDGPQVRVKEAAGTETTLWAAP